MARLYDYSADDPSLVVMHPDYYVGPESDELEARTDLYNTQNGSNKVYIMLKIRRYNMDENSIKYIVAALYGARGKKLMTTKKEFDDSFAAMQHYNKQIDTKRKGGYDLIHSEYSKKETQASRDSDMIADLVPMVKRLPTTEGIGSIEFISKLDDKHVMELITDFDEHIGYVFINFNVNNELVVVDRNLDVIERQPFHAKEYVHLVFIAYRKKSTGNYAIFDLAYVPNIPDVPSNTWDIRRTLLTTIYGHLFFTDESQAFNSDNKFHLNEYVYDEKEWIVNRTTDFNMLQLHSIHHKLGTPWEHIT